MKTEAEILAFLAKSADERIERLKLEINEGSLTARLTWEDSDGCFRVLSIPKGLTSRQALSFMDVFQLGREAGQDEGRAALRDELLALLGAAKRE